MGGVSRLALALPQPQLQLSRSVASTTPYSLHQRQFRPRYLLRLLFHFFYSRYKTLGSIMVSRLFFDCTQWRWRRGTECLDCDLRRRRRRRGIAKYTFRAQLSVLSLRPVCCSVAGGSPSSPQSPRLSKSTAPCSTSANRYRSLLHALHLPSTMPRAPRPRDQRLLSPRAALRR